MNPILQQLGYAPDDRVAIVHADDFGMCQATIPAIGDLFGAGLVTSAAVMVPCPWFPAAAELCRATPSLDIGVHTTLTCEWGRYRWGAITTSDPASGLVDSEGYLPRTTAAAAKADPRAVQVELQAQLDRALAAGIDVTHLDSHMGVAFEMPFIEGYLALGQRAQIPTLLPRMGAAALAERGLSPHEIDALARGQADLEQRGLALVDHLTWMPLEQFDDRLAVAKRQFDALPPGLSYFILHPAVDTPELRAIAPDWRARVGDYETFMSAELRAYVRSIGVQTIGYRALRDALRAHGGQR
jgi:chitin disaccharide deacetylase